LIYRLPLLPNSFHEKKYFSSRKEIFFFMKINISHHEYNSLQESYCMERKCGSKMNGGKNRIKKSLTHSPLSKWREGVNTVRAYAFGEVLL